MSVGDAALVGRATELEVARRAARDRGMVIAGPAGVGKSRILRELLHDLERDDVSVYRISTSPSLDPVRFGAFADLWPRQVPAETDHLLGEILRRVVDRAGGRHLVLGVDDGHHLDESSAEVLHTLVTRGLAAVVVTVRHRPQGPLPLRALWKDGFVPRLELQPLSRSEADRLAAAALGGEVAAPTLDRLWELSEGVPLFIRELLLDADEAGRLKRSHGLWSWDGAVAFGSRLSEIVGARVRRLPAPERRLLAMVSFAEPLPRRVASQLAEPAVVDSLEQAGMVESHGGADGVLRAAHPLFGEASRALVTGTEAVDVQRELAESWAASEPQGQDEWLRVAALAAQGGHPLPASIMADAARQALRLHDFVLAERLVRAGPSRPPERLMLAQALFQQSRIDDAVEVARSVRVEELDGELLAELARITMFLLLARGDEAGAREVGEEALKHAADPRWRGVIGGHIAAVALSEQGSEQNVNTVVELLRNPDPRVRVAALARSGTRLSCMGHPELVRSMSDVFLSDALALHDEVTDAPWAAASAHTTALAMSGRLTELDDFLDLLDDPDLPVDRADRSLIRTIRGRLRMLQGRPRSAVIELRNAVAAGEAASAHLRGRRWALALLAEGYAIESDDRRATATWQRVAEIDLPMSEPWDWDAQRAYTWVLAGTGSIDDGVTYALDLAQDFEAQGTVALALLASHDALRLGAIGEAARLVERLGPAVEGPWARAIVTHGRGLRDADGQLLDEASGAFEAMGADLHAAEAAGQAAVAHSQNGLRASATSASERSAVLADRCEGARTPAMAACTVPATLTTRERQVAELVARGHSNREVADHLGRSVRTVETHVSRVFAKLGVNRRAELADLFGIGPTE